MMAAVAVPRTLISEHQSISEIYTGLLIRAREIDNIEAKGTSGCLNCNRTKSQHISDNRCSCDSLSREFHSVHKEERERIDKCLKLIEELRTI